MPAPFNLIASLIIGWNIGKLYVPISKWLDDDGTKKDTVDSEEDEEEGDGDEKR